MQRSGLDWVFLLNDLFFFINNRLSLEQTILCIHYIQHTVLSSHQPVRNTAECLITYEITASQICEDQKLFPESC